MARCGSNRVCNIWPRGVPLDGLTRNCSPPVLDQRPGFAALVPRLEAL